MGPIGSDDGRAVLHGREDIYAAVAPALRRAGFDAVSASEVGRLGESDESQLAWAASQGRAIVTFNVRARLHATWLVEGRTHAGVVVSGQIPIGNLLRRLVRLAGERDSQTMIDRLEFLSDW